jgi:hypothetical protein
VVDYTTQDVADLYSAPDKQFDIAIDCMGTRSEWVLVLVLVLGGGCWSAWQAGLAINLKLQLEASHGGPCKAPVLYLCAEHISPATFLCALPPHA